MDLAQSVYEQAVSARFFGSCIVAAVQAVVDLLPKAKTVIALEVGAGTGGTASSVLPAIQGVCEQYLYTDVSDVFLRRARVRFAAFACLKCELLNIDVDPRLQGFAARQCDLVLATNVLHATPSMRNTLRNCKLLLKMDGLCAINELLSTFAIEQITLYAAPTRIHGCSCALA